MKITRLTVFALSLSCFLAGCLPSDEDIAVDTAAERRMAYLEWKKMRDRGESTSAKLDGPLSVDDAIKIALQYNKSLQSSIEDREVARGQRIAAWNVALPNLTVHGQGTRNENMIGKSGARTQLDSYSSSVQVTQPIMQGQAIPATLRSSRFFTALTDENIRQAVQDLIGNVAMKYYDILLAQHLLESNRVAVVSAEAQLRVVSEKRRYETATDYDVLRAQVDVATYRAEMLSQQNNIDTNRVALLKLMGVSQDSEITFSDDLRFLPMRPVFERAVEIASGLRPDLRQAELSARMSDEAVRIAQSGYWPSIAASFSQGWDNGWGGQNNIWKRNPWAAGLSATWRLGIDTAGNVTEARAQARQSRIAILDREETMLSDIRTQINSLANAEEVVRALEVNRSAAQEALRLVEIGYQAGVNTELDVQDARKALTDVQSQYFTALSDHTKARLNLQLAMGVLGPQSVDNMTPRPPSVPIADITEFAATDYEPLTSEDFLKNTIIPRDTGSGSNSGSGARAAPATPPSSSLPAQPAGSRPDEWPVMEDFLGSTQTRSESAPALAMAPARRVPPAARRPAPVQVETPPAGIPMPPAESIDNWRIPAETPVTAMTATVAEPAPPSAPAAPVVEQPKAQPLFKVMVREGSGS